MIFFLAGYESSAGLMTFFMYEMAKNPDIQQRVHDEIQEVLQRFDGNVSYDALNEMKLVEACIEGESSVFFFFFDFKETKKLN